MYTENQDMGGKYSFRLPAAFAGRRVSKTHCGILTTVWTCSGRVLSRIFLLSFVLSLHNALGKEENDFKKKIREEKYALDLVSSCLAIFP